jgi:2-polyprenyl-3-methyl-5-hydroxy-6-metoxy-1,4-benzoquinol methylase
MTNQPDPSSTVGYYNDRAEQFFSSTLRVDMSPIYERFLNGLAPSASILDAGCGSGRDARAFADLSFTVSAFDASEELAKRASEHCGFAVDLRRFEDVDEVAQYDAIWCCASLLHVPLSDMHGVLSKLWAALKAGSRMYVSYKHCSGTTICCWN